MAAADVTAPALIPDALDLPVAEPRETGGVTTRLVLDYVEREAGHVAVEAVLAAAGQGGREAQLRDENHWSPYATKIAMLEAAAQVLGDPLAARHIGAASMDFNVAAGIKVSLRAMGSLGLLYRNIPTLASKFTTTHRMDALEVGRNHARIAYVDTSGTGYHREDCELNIGFLSCGPAVFGLPLARITHPVCARDGGDTCVYEIRWQAGASRMRNALAAAGTALVAPAAALLADPALLPGAGAVSAAALALGAWGELSFRRRRWRTLEHHSERQADFAERLSTSLQGLVSELRLDDVLGNITKHAQSAVGGKEFVLLVDEGDGMRCRSASRIPETSIAALEAWASGSARAREEATVVDELSEVHPLERLSADRVLPLRSLCAAPLVYRGSSLGMIVALAHAPRGFLPHDVDLLQSYAAQAAIALTNARLYERQEELAARDPLTGLFNHREFHEAVEREVDAGHGVSVVLFDLDGFKQVNDSTGHVAGDRVLGAAADALRASCREGDAAFRVGGDEFAIVLPRTVAADAERIADRAASGIRSDGRVGVSYGVAEFPLDATTKNVLLATADERLYAMKRAQTRRPHARADRQRARLACASRLSAKLLPVVDPDEIAWATVEELHDTFGYHLAVVFRLDADAMLRPVAGVGGLAEQMGRFMAYEQPVATGLVGRVARSGKTALVADTATDPDFHYAGVPTDSGSELDVAIRVNGRIWGVLTLEHVDTHAFDGDDVVFADLVAAHVGAALDRARLRDELEGTLMTTLAALCDALEEKDAYTAQHAGVVADLSEAVAQEMGLTGTELRTVRYAALLHDIGKIGIPTEILTKPGRLTVEEFALMKQHTIIGQRILERIPFFADVHRPVRWAHERWDGRGYPDGIAGEEIPLASRIIGACDAFHAMTSDRPYRAAMPVEDAVAELQQHAGTQFDPGVVEVLVERAVGAGCRG